MVMAHLPATVPKSSPGPKKSKLTRYIEKALRKGFGPQEIAAKLAPDDKAKQKRIRSRVYMVAARDQEWQAMQHAKAQMALTAGLEDASEGLAKMAKRGRSPQAKLLFEATGFYTPHSRTDHNHSGEIEIKMTGIPRPTHQDEEPVEAQAYEDAEVVE